MGDNFLKLQEFAVLAKMFVLRSMGFSLLDSPL